MYKHTTQASWLFFASVHHRWSVGKRKRKDARKAGGWASSAGDVTDGTLPHEAPWGPGVVVRAGGKREFDNEGPSVHESLRMLGGKPATELREFPEVVAKRRRGEKPYMDDDDEAGGASTQAAVDVGAKPRARPVQPAPGRDDDDGENVAIAAADVVFAGGSWAPTAQTERTTPAPTVRPPSRIANRRPSSIAIG